MHATAKNRVLYISYNGIREPLVESQVLAYLRQLVKNGYRFTLVTYERDQLNDDFVESKCLELSRLGIDWSFIYANKRLGALSAIVDVVNGVRLTAKLCQQAKFIHARSFIPAVIARIQKRRYGISLLNDIRGFWVDEKVYKNSISAGGVVFRLGKRVESWVFGGSDYIVSLTDAGQRELLRLPYFKSAPPPMVTIPTCADVERFNYDRGTERESRPLIIGYVGSLSDDYMPDRVFRLFKYIRELSPTAQLRLISRTDPDKVASVANIQGVLPGDYVLVASDPEGVPMKVADFDWGLSFIKPGYAKIASCPTKVGEYLAAGVPIICNATIGDVDQIMDSATVGVLLDDLSDETLALAAKKIVENPVDSALRGSCRSLAEDYFTLSGGVDKYLKVYSDLLQMDSAESVSEAG